MNLGLLAKQPENYRTIAPWARWSGLGVLSSSQDTRSSRKHVLTAEFIAVHVLICSFLFFFF